MEPVGSKVSKVRRRIAAQRAIEAATLAAVGALALGCALLFARRAGWVGPWTAWLLGWALGLSPLAAGVIAAAGRRVTGLEAARALDAAGALADRIGSALALGFGQAPPGSPFGAALWRDAGRAAERADPRRAAPFRPPRDLRALGLAGGALAATWAIGFPAPPAPAPPAAAAELYLEIPAAELELAARAAERAAEEAERLDDDELRRLAAELRTLWADVREEKLGREEAFAKLAAIEERAERATAGEFPLVRSKLRAVGKALAREKALGELGRALDVEDFAKARAELDRLARALAEGRKSPEEMRRLARAVSAAAAAAAPATDLEKRADALRKEIEALEKKPERTPEEERKLARKKDDLAALEKEMEKSAEERKMVERLERDLEDLAEALAAAEKDRAAGAAQEVEDELGGMESKLGRSEAIAKLKKALAEGKVAVASGKMRQRGEGEDEGGEDGEGPGGGEGEGEGEGERYGVKLKMKRFMVKAGKGGPGAGAPGSAAPDGPGSDPLAAGKDGKEPGSDDGSGDGDGAKGPGDVEPGPSGPGSSPDRRGPGDSSALKGAMRKDVDVPGKRGDGPVRSTVMMGAATKGFAVRGYRPLYEAAAATLEEALEEDRVPLGYKTYVRRYMELIRPE